MPAWHTSSLAARCRSSAPEISVPASPLVRSILCGSGLDPSPRSGVPRSVVASPIAPCPTTRLQHGIRKPKIYMDGTVRYGLLTTLGKPQHCHEALANEMWKKAMDNEFEALLNNHI
jgi:hypothetical protein